MKRILKTVIYSWVLVILLSVPANAAEVKLNYTKRSLAPGASVTLKLMNSNKKIIWSSSDTSVAEVSQKGKVTAKNPGKTFIKAKSGKAVYQCGVTVTEQAALNITVKMIYKKDPVNVNATYYLGLFSDRALKKRLTGKAFKLKNKSEVTSCLKINLDRLANRRITLYIAETDRHGVPLKSGNVSGYDIIINGKKKNLVKITLSRTNMVENVTVKNRILPMKLFIL